MTVERVLVVYASDQGSTREIAEFIGTELRMNGFVVNVCAASEKPDVSVYDAVVLGSAVHDRALLPSAERFARQNATAVRDSGVAVQRGHRPVAARPHRRSDAPCGATEDRERA